MSKKKIVILLIVLIIITIITIKVEIYPFGYRAEEISEDTKRVSDYNTNEDIPNTSIYSYKVNTKINSKDDFITFLKKHAKKKVSYMDEFNFELGSFMNSNGDINWIDVNNSIEISRMLWKKVFTLHYKTLDPECNGYKLSITNNGYVLDYRSAGK